MKTFLKIVLAFLIGIALSACRETDERPPEPPQPPVDEDIDYEDPDDVDIDHENEIIDALEIDPHWNQELEEDTGAVFERVLKTCTEIEDGLLISDVVLDMMNDGISQLSAEHMVETSVFIVCPEFESNYEAYLQSRS